MRSQRVHIWTPLPFQTTGAPPSLFYLILPCFRVLVVLSPSATHINSYFTPASGVIPTPTGETASIFFLLLLSFYHETSSLYLRWPLLGGPSPLPLAFLAPSSSPPNHSFSSNPFPPPSNVSSSSCESWV